MLSHDASHEHPFEPIRRWFGFLLGVSRSGLPMSDPFENRTACGAERSFENPVPIPTCIQRHDEFSAVFAFASRACLAAAVAVAVAALTLPVALANAARAEETPAGASLDFNKKDGTLYIEWSGPIVAGMADYLRTALGRYGTVSHRVVLVLNSAGGQVEEGHWR
jgi:hypothetical protein